MKLIDWVELAALVWLALHVLKTRTPAAGGMMYADNPGDGRMYAVTPDGRNW